MASVVSLGLGGDGDEVVAIDAAFKAIGIPVPAEDAHSWVTVGDVWKSAEKADLKKTEASGAWENFRIALCSQSSVDAQAVCPETLLLCQPYGLRDLGRDIWRRIYG